MTFDVHDATRVLTEIRVPQHVMDDIDAHAREAWPNECCGLLVGSANAIAASFRARNERSSPTRYQIAAEDHFAAIRHARARELKVIGAYHSHPSSSPVPSSTDVIESISGDFLYLIHGRESSSSSSIRAWRIVDGNFRAVPLVTVR
jgi:proteasome lid subunit RPN8/RPN11